MRSAQLSRRNAILQSSPTHPPYSGLFTRRERAYGFVVNAISIRTAEEKFADWFGVRLHADLTPPARTHTLPSRLTARGLNRISSGPIYMQIDGSRAKELFYRDLCATLPPRDISRRRKQKEKKKKMITHVANRAIVEMKRVNYAHLIRMRTEYMCGNEARSLTAPVQGPMKRAHDRARV